MTSIAGHLNELSKELPERVKLVAVTKNQPVEVIMEAYNAGHRCFGENKAQELISKAPILPGDIEWHFIGHLQTNKVKFVIPYVSVIHSVDSMRLLLEIIKESDKQQRKVECLLQFHIASEETKYGLLMNEAEEIFRNIDVKSCMNLSITGVMGMATFTDDEKQIAAEFTTLQGYFNALKERWFINDTSFCEISMGMSDDYKIALKQGSTIVRIGSRIFGSPDI